MGTDDGQAEQEKALVDTVERTAPKLLRFAAASVGSHDDAVRLVEEAFVQASEGGDDRGYEIGSLFALVRRKAAQLSERRRTAVATRTPQPEIVGTLDQVRPTEREALLLHYVGLLSVTDLATATGTDESLARRKLSRGLSFLCRLTSDAVDPGTPTAEVAARRKAVEESLADVVDGLAPDDLTDFIAGDDPSRDLVHDAERVVAAIRALEPESSFDLPVLSKRFAEACTAARARAAEEAASRSAAPATKAAAAEPRIPDATDERRGRKKRLAVAGGIVAILGLSALVVGHTAGDKTKYAGAAWSGSIASVSRAFGGGVGLERCSPDRAICSRVDRGDEVPAGSTLRTDGQTRAVVELRDGTRLVLDRDTELLFDGDDARRARLDHGSVVADVPLLGASRARFDLPLGFTEAAGAKASLIAETSRDDVEVARGSVRLVDARERGIAVYAGEVGTLEPGAAPAVYASASLGERFGWTERAFSPRTEGEEDIRGLGELRAKRPGEEHEKKGLVSLASHVARVRIAGNVARTEIEEEFQSSSDDVLEGVFRFPLPPDAQIERLALEVDGKVEEGAFVDRDRASAIWRGAIVNAGAKKPVGEEIVWVPGPWRDPALLEWQRGGRFELRIYPIPRRASRKVLLAYTQVVPDVGGVRRFSYPLPYDPSGSTKIGRFDLDVQVRGHDARPGVSARGYEMRQQALPDGAQELAYVRDGFMPSGDLTVEYSLPEASREVTAWAYEPGPEEQPLSTPSAGVTAGAFVAIALRPKLPRSQDGLQRDFAIVVDSSRSMYGERFRRAAALAESAVREMDRADNVTVLACDTTCRALPAGVIAAGPDAANAVAAFLQTITPEGGSDVAAAVRHGKEALHDAPKGAARVVYIGDGTPTIGPVGPALIRREIEASVPRDVGTVTAVAIGADADVATLTTLADAGGGVLVPYAPGQALLDTAFALLGATYGTTLTDASVELPDGLSDVAPHRLGTFRAGGETIVVARMDRPSVAGTLTLKGRIGGAPFEQRYPLHVEATTSKGNAFVPRLWAAAKIATLESEPYAESRKLAVELSGHFHVASRYTSLLVLESEAMMHAFGLTKDERAAAWTGESAAESTTAEGEAAVVDADDGRGALAKEPAADLDMSGLGSSGAGESSARRSAPIGGADKQRAAATATPPAAHAAAAPMPVTPAPEAKKKAERMDRDEFYEREGGGNGYAPAPPPMTAPPANRPSASAYAMKPEDLMGPSLMPSPLEQQPPRFGRRYIPMRKIWELVGHIVTPASAPAQVTPEAIAAAEHDASGADPRRESLKRLYTLYSLDGMVEQASTIAERWSAKDPLDPEALTARADVAAARGDRDTAIRILGSVIDVRPGDQKAVFRLARLHRWAGRAELACRHSEAAAEIRATDAKLLAEAVRCTRDLGQSSVSSDLMGQADEATRRSADALLAAKPADPSVLSGELRLEATWDGGDDVDLALLSPDGSRVSWLGAPTRAVITARDVESTSREGLALRGGAPGDYVVELTRPLGHRGVVRGSLVVFAAGDRRTVPFAFEGPNTRVALLKVSSRSRLVPL